MLIILEKFQNSSSESQYPLQSLKVIGTDMDRRGTDDLLLTFYSNYGPTGLSLPFSRHGERIANFPHQPHSTPLQRGFPGIA